MERKDDFKKAGKDDKGDGGDALKRKIETDDASNILGHEAQKAQQERIKFLKGIADNYSGIIGVEPPDKLKDKITNLEKSIKPDNKEKPDN